MDKNTCLQKLYRLAEQKWKLLSGATQFVFYRGNPHANLMLVGEAPGRDEDAQGFPFVGAAGKLLDKTLRELGLDPERDVFITNIVKSRPPNNRKPTPEEMAEGRSLLIEEIKCIHPKVICTLGASPLEGLSKQHDLRITKVRGQVLHVDSYLLLPTYHPAYLLRNPTAITEFKQDLLTAKKLIQG